MQLTPLQRSAEYDSIEAQLKALFLSLYQKHMAAKVTELGLSGMPNLASDQFISRELSNDGLAILRDTTDENIRYLFHALRYRNPQRGTHFLRTYMRALFGDVFTIEQLWCLKDGTYPVDVLSEPEIIAAGHDLADYWLTSRLRVDIETEIVPERILNAARTAVAAKFVLELRSARRTSSTYGVMFTGNSVLVCRTSGSAEYLQPAIESPTPVNSATVAGGSTLTFSYSGGPDTQSHLN